ncbi:MAG TPA: glycosyltransferase [Candidatus Saccharimonadales bacterium]|nr:glycosyltransferase [Candidatus Saccharimonadales bacterium]
MITGLNTGGAEKALCRLLESLPPSQFAHVVVALGPEAALSTRVAKVAALHHLGMRAGRLYPGNLLQLRSILRRVQPDVIQGWMYHANFMATLAAMGLNVPTVWGIRQTLYSLDHEKAGTRWVIRACAWLSRRSARIVYNSQLSRTQHVKFGFHDSRALIIPNGFNTHVFIRDPDACSRVRAEFGISEDTVAIGLVARLHPMKDHANFLRAASRFVTNHTNAEFVLVGDGVDGSSPELMRLVNELQLQGKVHLCGRRMDIAAINNALDIASLSSAWGEACPNAIGEAMACGTPCVATDIGDVRDIIGETGVVVPPRDPDALSKGWSKLFALGTEGRRMLGKCARQRIASHYSLAANAAAYAKLYRSLVRRPETCVA